MYDAPPPLTPPRNLYLRAMSYFVKDLPLILALVVLIGCTVVLGLLEPWPVAVLVDVVLSPQPKSDPMHRLILGLLPSSPWLRIAGLALLAMFIKVLMDLVWLARMMRTAFSARSFLRCLAFSWKAASPATIPSSISRISGSMVVAMEKARRAPMPWL